MMPYRGSAQRDEILQFHFSSQSNSPRNKSIASHVERLTAHVLLARWKSGETVIMGAPVINREKTCARHWDCYLVFSSFVWLLFFKRAQFKNNKSRTRFLLGKLLIFSEEQEEGGHSRVINPKVHSSVGASARTLPTTIRYVVKYFPLS